MTEQDGKMATRWPYDYVEEGEVRQEMTWQEAKNLRQELERLRSQVDEWSCDRCRENKTTVWKPATDENLCNDCTFGDEDE